MEVFAERLRERARQLGLSDAEVARRIGLEERRYGHYVRGAREPDFATLLRICSVLDLTPNELLIPSRASKPQAHDLWLSRLTAVGRKLNAEDVKLAVRQVEAILKHRSEASRSKRSSAAHKR